jgi:hypothetical protein
MEFTGLGLRAKPPEQIVAAQIKRDHNCRVPPSQTNIVGVPGRERRVYCAASVN